MKMILPMRRRWIVLFLTVCLAATLWMQRRRIPQFFRSPPSLASALTDIQAGRLLEAEATLNRYLSLHPDHRDANLVKARVELDRPNPKPEEALKCLDRVRGQDPRLRATVLTLRGKALYMLNRFAEAEPCWHQALALHPTVAEAGWLLLQLFYLQGRSDESSELALRLAPSESDPVDRIRYLLELVREDVEKLSAAGIHQWLEPVVKLNPDDVYSSRALGEALAKMGRGEEGVAMLRQLVDRDPRNLSSWTALLDALSNSGEIDSLAKELERVPASIAEDPRFALYRGRVAQERGEIASAINDYEKALAVRPTDVKLLYRLGRCYRIAKRVEDAKKIEETEAALAATQKALGEILKEADGIKNLGIIPAPALYQRIADLRERAGKREEAIAWHKQVIRDDPANLVSARTLSRLSAKPPSLNGH